MPIYIDTIATLNPYHHINLKSKVSGTVEYMSANFETGAIVKKGTVLIRLDKKDYVNEVKRLEANLIKAEANYKLELGQQEIVQTELKQLEQLKSSSNLKNTLHTDLTLRKPQLEQVLSDVIIAQANLDDAKNKLNDTEITAPFDAMILSRSISYGQNISANEALAELVSIEKYLAEVSIPVDTLYNNKLLDKAHNDIPIKILTNYKEIWGGTLLQIVSALTTESRMGKLIISVDDPLSLKEDNTRVPLLLGDQVHVYILAGTYDDVLALPRNAVYNNENIWVLDDKNTLHYKKVEVVWSDGNYIYIKNTGLEEAKYVLESGINNPVENLLVKPTVINSETLEVDDEPTQKQTARQPRQSRESRQENSNNAMQEDIIPNAKAEKTEKQEERQERPRINKENERMPKARMPKSEM